MKETFKMVQNIYTTVFNMLHLAKYLEKNVKTKEPLSRCLQTAKKSFRVSPKINRAYINFQSEIYTRAYFRGMPYFDVSKK